MVEPKAQLQRIKDAAVSNGDAVKGQINNIVTSFQGSTTSMRQQIVTQVDDIKGKYQEPAKMYDGYRWVCTARQISP